MHIYICTEFSDKEESNLDLISIGKKCKIQEAISYSLPSDSSQECLVILSHVTQSYYTLIMLMCAVCT